MDIATAAESSSATQELLQRRRTRLLLWQEDALVRADMFLDAAVSRVCSSFARDAVSVAMEELGKSARAALIAALPAAHEIVHASTVTTVAGDDETDEHLPPALTAESVATVLCVAMDTARAVAFAAAACQGTPHRAYVINRKSRSDRWGVMQRQFAMVPFMRAVRVEAAEGADLALDPQELARLSVRARSTLIAKQAPTDIDSWGAVGCTESHIIAWKDIVARGEAAFVFEDDAMLGLGKLALLAAALVADPTAHGLDFLLLGSHTLRRPTAVVPLRLPMPAAAAGARRLLRLPPHLEVQLILPFPHGMLATGSHAYWVTPRAAAAFLASAIPIEVAVDTYMQYVLAERCAYVALMEGVRAHGTLPPNNEPAPVDAAAAATVSPALLPPAAGGSGKGDNLWAAWLFATTTVPSSSDIHHGVPTNDAEEGSEALRIGEVSNPAMASAAAAVVELSRRFASIRHKQRGSTPAVSLLLDRMSRSYVAKRLHDEQRTQGTNSDVLEHKALLELLLARVLPAATTPPPPPP